MLKFEDLKGKTLFLVEQPKNEDKITFITEQGDAFELDHMQDCCERVYVESIVGDLQDLVGAEILMAEEVSYCNETPDGIKPQKTDDSYTWTFYKIATLKGYVDIRFLGTSNGYYSEKVSFVKNENLTQEYSYLKQRWKLKKSLEENLPKKIKKKVTKKL